MDVTYYELVPEHAKYIRKLAHRVAQSYGLPPSLEITDLVQIGSMAALEYAPAYDPQRGSFRTYIAKRVQGALQDACHRRKVQYAGPRFLPERMLRIAEDVAMRMAHGDIAEEALPAHPDTAAETVLLHEVQRELARFPEQTQRAFALLLQGLTMHEVGAELGITESAVSLIYSKTIRTLRQRYGLTSAPGSLSWRNGRNRRRAHERRSQHGHRTD